MTKIKDKYVPGLELLYLQEYDSTKSTGSSSKEVGMLYKLEYGEVGARVVCKSNPIAHLTGTLRLFNSRLTGYELTSVGLVDVNRRRLYKWNIGLTIIAGNLSGQLKLHANEIVVSTRHRIHPRFVSLTENRLPYRERQHKHKRSTLAMGFEFELSSRLALEVMVSHFQPPTFALQYHCSNPQCVVRVSSDVYSNRTGVSIAFHPSSFFSSSP
ncbi:uncharacterized protein LOC112086216 [Eutrema salsugineum]|uniref:uncharacterized protein LOC112086216 n=1 Tax=Eutrema salsugineum TaxID=72664 RepID=UPI000CED3299|nr:uncharacterized protein LOC112086216 [Eutrema salsugineum]